MNASPRSSSAGSRRARPAASRKRMCSVDREADVGGHGRAQPRDQRPASVRVHLDGARSPVGERAQLVGDVVERALVEEVAADREQRHARSRCRRAGARAAARHVAQAASQQRDVDERERPHERAAGACVRGPQRSERLRRPTRRRRRRATAPSALSARRAAGRACSRARRRATPRTPCAGAARRTRARR